MASIADKLQQVRQRIATACAAAQSPVQSVTLLAVSKDLRWRRGARAPMPPARRPSARTMSRRRWARSKPWPTCGQRSSGTWSAHCKATRRARSLRSFDWVHTIDRLKLAERLSAQRPPGVPPLQLCLQVNISGEASKSGVAPAEVLRWPVRWRCYRTCGCVA